MATIDKQRVVPREKILRCPPNVCGGCLDAIVPSLNAYCPACTARQEALDPIYDAVDEALEVYDAFREEGALATQAYRLQGRPMADVSAARDRLIAAHEAVLERAEEVLERYAP